MVFMHLATRFRNRGAARFAPAPLLTFLARAAGVIFFVGLWSESVQAGQISLAWDANTESDLAGYRVYYGTQSGAYSSQTNLGKVTSVTISGLNDTATYYFTVRALNTAGLISDPSNEVSGRPAFSLLHPVIHWATPTGIMYGTKLGSNQLNAKANVVGSFVYSPAAGYVPPAGSGQVLRVTFTPADSRYATAQASVLLNVSRAPLTITALNQSRPKGMPNPVLTASYSGFVNGDTPARLSTPVSLATTATQSSLEGIYPITAQGASSPNYAITHRHGTLTVTPAVLASIGVSPSSASLTVGQKQTFTAQGRYSDQTSRDLTLLAAWFSSSTAVATVASGGLVTAVAGGSATIRASYGGLSGSAAVNVTGSGIATRQFGNATRIVIRDNNTAAPYPSVVSVSGMPTLIEKATLTLTNLSHTWLYDVNILLVSPAGKKVLLMEQVGWKTSVSRIQLTFDDAATALLPTSGIVTSGRYRPTAYSSQLSFPSLAPAMPYATTLSSLVGSNPNGSWQLYVWDNGAGDVGEISGGWGLTIAAKSSSGTLSVNEMVHRPGEALVQPELPAQPISIHSIVRLENGLAGIRLQGRAGQAYRLQRTTDWITWQDIVAGVMSGETEDTIDPDLRMPEQGFYRVQPEGSPADSRISPF